MLFDTPSSQIRGLTTQRKVQGDLVFYPCTRSGAAIGGDRLSGSHHLNDLVESVNGTMGDHSRNGQESGSKRWETTSENLRCLGVESAWPSYSARGKAAYMGKGHSLGGRCVVTPSDDTAWESVPMPTEHSAPEILSGGRRVR